MEDIASRETRVAFELAIDTGRRPDDICELPWDCLQRDDDGQPVLAYDNHKAQRLGRRLPIPEATAELITEQKKRVRQRYPDAPLVELKLLPSPVCNPKGDKAINDSSVSERHRAWVDSLPPLLRTDGTEFDKAQVFLYAYRHTYAQRHADAGVPVDVLRELLDHRMLDTTKRYYRVGHQRRREAVGQVTALQFDRRGDRVWRQAKALLDTEHARRIVGEVVVPFGVCSEPSNVKAGGPIAPTGSAAWAAITSAPTSPTCLICRLISMTCCATENACSPRPKWTPGQRLRQCPPRRRSAASDA